VAAAGQDEVGIPFVLADVVDREHVRVVERSREPRFLLEPPGRSRCAGSLIRQDFDRDLASDPGIASAVHLAHAARADRREHLVRADPAASGQRHEPPSARG